MPEYNEESAKDATGTLRELAIIFEIVRELAILQPETCEKLGNDPEVKEHFEKPTASTM